MLLVADGSYDKSVRPQQHVRVLASTMLTELFKVYNTYLTHNVWERSRMVYAHKSWGLVRGGEIWSQDAYV